MSFTHQFHVNTLSQVVKEKKAALILKNIQTAIIPDREQAERGVGHGVFLKEQGFYPLGHRSGIIVLSYHDPIQQAVIYEKLIFLRTLSLSEIQERPMGLEEGERLISFE